jgi:hypothetical protein
VRHVIPGKGNYLQPAAEPYALVDGQDRLLRDELLRCLRDRRFGRVDLLVSFVMKSGLELVHGGLVDALDRGAEVRVLTTDYLTVTDADALARLLDLAEVRPEAVATRVFHDPATSFHPKAYLFSSADGVVAAAFVGSNNLAITRARSSMTVVSSFSAQDMDPSRLRAEGAQMLCRYLTYAESGGSDLGHAAKAKPDLYPFERDVDTQLRSAGIPLIAQYGSSGYWIDFAA